jgi:glycosyltransferase involved in cell wall biosynthesis
MAPNEQQRHDIMNSVRTHPRILRVEAETLYLLDTADGSVTPVLDLSAQTPRWWRKVEKLLRLDIALAVHASRVQDRGDIIWAGSEKIGIPLSFLRLHKPLVVIAHHMSSPAKARFARATGVVARWDGIGFISDESREFFVDYFGVSPDRLFQYETSKYLDKYNPQEAACDGPIMSVGVAKRDYVTLIKAFAVLPECDVELYISSKFGDTLQKQARIPLPAGVKIMGWVSDEELLHRYHRARFVAVPLDETTHSGAGINAVLEASALGKAVIATNTGGMPTFVKDGETGILVPPNDVNAWVDAVRLLWTQPELARQMGQAGRCYVQSRFSPAQVGPKINALLDSLYVRSNCD